MPLHVDDVALQSALGSARPYAAELGCRLDQELFPVELAALLAAERLEAIFTPKHVMRVMRWMSNFLSQLEIEREKPPEVLTVLDYRWVLALGAMPLQALDATSGLTIGLDEMSKKEPVPEISIAISLHAIYVRRIRPLVDRKGAPA